MSNIIRALNNQYLTASKSYLSGDVAVGATNLLVKNHNNFTDDWTWQLGETGEERAEVGLVNGVPAGGTVVAAAGIRYAHPIDTPIYGYKYNQVVFLRSTAGTAGTAAAMTDGTVTITPDQFDRDGNSYTIFEDTTGSASYTYKTRFRNSALGVESADSDWIYPPGASSTEPYSLYKLRTRVKNKLLNNVKDEVIDEWLNEWHESMTNGLIEINRDFAIGTTAVAFTANSQYGTITAEDFKLPRHVTLANSAGTYEVVPKELTDNKPVTNNFMSGKNSYFFRGDAVVGRDPYAEAGTLNIEYYKLNPQLDSDGDSLPLPMRGYTRSYVKYCEAQAAGLDNRPGDKKSLENEAEGLRAQFMSEMSPRQQDGPEYVKVTNAYEKIF